MSNEQRAQEQAQNQQPAMPQAQAQDQDQSQAQAQEKTPPAQDVDGLKDKKPEELTPEELRLMADTMPGEGPGD